MDSINLSIYVSLRPILLIHFKSVLSGRMVRRKFLLKKNVQVTVCPQIGRFIRANGKFNQTKYWPSSVNWLHHTEVLVLGTSY